jgi:hypothetical protein
MKNMILKFTAGLFLSAQVATAQIAVNVTEQVQTMSLGDRTGYSVTLTGMTEKEAIKAMRSWAGDQQKKPEIKETGKHELMINQFSGAGFSEAPANLYLLFSEGDAGLTVTGFFEKGGVFVSSATDAATVPQCKQVMTKYAWRIEKIKIETELAGAQKELEKRNDEQAALEKKQKQLNEDIADCEETIKNAKAGLEQNATEQKNKREEIGKQDAKVKEVENKLKDYDGK